LYETDFQVLSIQNTNANLCLCGDVNSIRFVDERKSRGTAFRQSDSDIFNSFIGGNSLVDTPLCGRAYTWYCGDGSP